MVGGFALFLAKYLKYPNHYHKYGIYRPEMFGVLFNAID